MKNLIFVSLVSLVALTAYGQVYTYKTIDLHGDGKSNIHLNY